jgi:toxin YoeB
VEVIYTEVAQDDIAYWKKSRKVKIMQKITSLINSIQNNPFDGEGKPEPLKHQLSGKWSRRINQEHRIVYEIMDEFIIVHSLRGHY